jgi:hypothetical protein
VHITLTWEPYERAYAVRFAYNARVVDVVKELPYSYRRWDSLDRCWYVELSCIPERVTHAPLRPRMRPSCRSGGTTTPSPPPKRRTGAGQWC